MRSGEGVPGLLWALSQFLQVVVRRSHIDTQGHRDMAKGWEGPEAWSEAQKSSPSGPPEGTKPANTLIQTSSLRAVREKNFCCYKPVCDALLWWPYRKLTLKVMLKSGFSSNSFACVTVAPCVMEISELSSGEKMTLI